MNIKRDIKWLLLIFLVTFVLLFKLFYNCRLYGHDTIFHTSNIIYLSKTISIRNIFGDNIISNSINRFGYGTWLFYPKLPHLLGAYFYIVTNNVYLSMNFIYFIVTFLSGMFTFYLSRRLFNNNKVAFLSSVIYLCYSYHICEMYIRDAYAENFMFLVIPIVFLGLLNLRDNNYKKFYMLFIFGYLLGIYSHLVSMFFCTFFVLLFIIFYKKNFFIKEKIKAFFISGTIIFFLSLPFLVSIIEHRLFGKYVVFTDSFSSVYSTMNSVISFNKYFINSKYAIYNNILVYVNYCVMLLICLTTIVFLIGKYRNVYKTERKLLFYSILILVAFINSKVLWEGLPSFFSMIQFPWRLVTFLSLVISLYAPLFFVNFYKRCKYFICFLYVFVILVIIVEGINNIFYFGNKEYNYDEITNFSAFMGWQMEYLPVNNASTREILFNKDNLDYGIKCDDDVEIEVLFDKFPEMEFKVVNMSNKSYIVIPRTYYLGYSLVRGNRKYKISESDDGLLGTTIDSRGIYKLKYTGTVCYNVSVWVRNILFLVVILFLIIKRGGRNG